MAGAGYKLFSTGDVLSASDVNLYLQQQTVMVFASAAARTTALASVLAEGMVTYLKDTDVVEIYTGAAWVSLDDPNAIQNSIVDAKGDIITATADNTPARLAVGATNGMTLQVDSSTATGLKWAAASSGAMTLITSQSFTTSSNINVNSCFSATYQNYVLQIIVSNTSAASDAFMRLRASGTDASGTDYKWAWVGNSSTSGTATGAASDSASAWSDNFIGYDSSGKVALNATMFRPFEATSTFITSQAVSSPMSTNKMLNYQRSGVHSLTNSYDGFSLTVNSGTITGNLRVYGLANS